jgi:hypothetical protein
MPAKKMDATHGSANIVPRMEINPFAPPKFVRHKPTGMTMNWSGIFRRRVDEFEPYYRPNTSDQQDHMLLLQRYELTQAMYAGANVNPAVMAMMMAGAQSASPFAGHPGVIDGELAGTDS